MKNINTSSDADGLLADLQASIARASAKHHSTLIKGKMRQRLMAGYAITRPPFCYEVTRTKGVFKPTQYGQSLGYILKAVASNDLPITQAVETFKHSVEAISGRRLSNTIVSNHICNPYYAGYLIYENECYLGKHIPLITAEQHVAIVEKLKCKQLDIENKTVHCPVCYEFSIKGRMA